MANRQIDLRIRLVFVRVNLLGAVLMIIGVRREILVMEAVGRPVIIEAQPVGCTRRTA